MTLGSGCATLGYLYQAAKGQFALINHARPIGEVVKDARTPPHVKELLLEVALIKKYGESQGLKATRNYEEYVKIDGDAVSYVVTASDPLAFKPKVWSFPIAGSFTYLGWFDLNRARSFAGELRSEGYDVDLRGAAAYSTLGWFRDPVLSTMLSRDPGSFGGLVNVILHESVHATVYLSEQSAFNESLASFIADRMTLGYFDSKGAEFAAAKQAYLQAERDSEDRRKAFHGLYQKLEALYASDAPKEEKLSRKEEWIEDLRKKLGIQRAINNATLIQFRTYRSEDQGFEELWKRCSSDWRRFIQAVGRIRNSDFPEKQMDSFAKVLGACRC